MCDELARRYPNVTNAEFERLEKACGLTHDENNMAYSEEIRQICDCISSTYWDWMHAYCASSGLAHF
eukprot:5841355-Pyramimonas_sp.AAC.1